MTPRATDPTGVVSPQLDPCPRGEHIPPTQMPYAGISRSINSPLDLGTSRRSTNQQHRPTQPYAWGQAASPPSDTDPDARGAVCPQQGLELAVITLDPVGVRGIEQVCELTVHVRAPRAGYFRA